MHNLAKESYLFEYHQREQLAELEKRRQINAALPERRRSHVPAQFHNFWHTLDHIRRIRIEVTFNYQETHPETA